MGRCRPTLEAPRKKGSWGLGSGLCEIFFKAIEKASSWFVKVSDRKFNLGLSEEQENAPQRDTRNREIEKGCKRYPSLCRNESVDGKPHEYAEACHRRL